MARPDTDPVCYRQGFTCSDIGPNRKGRTKWGVSVKEYLLSNAPIVESTYDKGWRMPGKGRFFKPLTEVAKVRKIDLPKGFCFFRASRSKSYRCSDVYNYDAIKRVPLSLFLK